MPATFESLGIKFMYPDNWVVADRAAEEGIEGVTLELPSGGFFSIERMGQPSESEDGKSDEEKLLAAVERLIAEEYGEVEREEWAAEKLQQADRVVEFSFYYLDLLIVSRLIFLELDREKFAIQIQSESRGFEENELVFAAIMQQLPGAPVQE